MNKNVKPNTKVHKPDKTKYTHCFDNIDNKLHISRCTKSDNDNIICIYEYVWTDSRDGRTRRRKVVEMFCVDGDVDGDDDS
jgi:hypothetical protein